jgi:ATP-dependent DNA ligase
LIDGEAVLLGVNGVSDFDGLHSGWNALMLDGEELRKLPLLMRKTRLDRLLARRLEGIFIAH